MSDLLPEYATLSTFSDNSERARKGTLRTYYSLSTPRGKRPVLSQSPKGEHKLSLPSEFTNTQRKYIKII